MSLPGVNSDAGKQHAQPLGTWSRKLSFTVGLLLLLLALNAVRVVPILNALGITKDDRRERVRIYSSNLRCGRTRENATNRRNDTHRVRLIGEKDGPLPPRTPLRTCTSKEGGRMDPSEYQHPPILSSENVLFSPPEPNWPPFFAGPCVGFDRVFLPGRSARYAVILNAWNAEKHIGRTLTQLIKLTRGSWELILVSDGSTDDTAQQAMELLQRFPHWPACARTEFDTDVVGEECHYAENCKAENFVRARVVIVASPGILEPSSNNLGMRMAEDAEFFIIFQDDSMMTTAGWNVQAAAPLKMYPDVFSASMKAAHSWPVYSEDDVIGYMRPPWGFYVRDTGNRGPLILRAEFARDLRYMDEVHFQAVIQVGMVLNSDHEFNSRAYGNGTGRYAHHRHWVSGYVPVPWVEFKIRSPRTEQSVHATKRYLDWIEARRKRIDEEVGAELGSSSVPNTHNENRELPPGRPSTPFFLDD